jgi:hypothetical protein
MSNEILKLCRTCDQSKPLDSFHNSKREKDGKQSCCKECKRIVAKNYRSSIVYKEYQKKYRQTDSYKKYQKKYAKINKEQSKDYHKQYHKTDKFKQYQQSEKYKKYKKLYDQKDIVKENRKIRITKDTVNLKEYYLKNKLKQKGFTNEQIKNNPELLEIQKLIIKTIRLCKTSQN